MITYALSEHIPAIRILWKEVFHDTDAFLDLYFRDIFKPEQCVVSIQKDLLYAAMQMLPYDFYLKGEKYKAVYIFAVMTAPKFRNQGHMKRMFEFALRELAISKVDFVFLIPQTPDLFQLYAKFGFSSAFIQPKNKVQLPLCSNDLEIPTLDDAYVFYRKTMQGKPSILQSKPQFLFNASVLRQEGGELYAYCENKQMQALCFVLPQANELRILDLVCVEDTYSQILLGALQAKYKVDTAILSTYTPTEESTSHIAMAYILQPTKISLPDLSKAYLSLMMNE